jgi:uncharacterized protein (TIGR02453 family)
VTEFDRFTPALFQFLEDLQRNNTRDWFQSNKNRYERDVREPSLAFVREMGDRFGPATDALLAIDKKSGGSLMRIHRDTRFSNDKSPYKTNVGIQFRHRSGKDVHAPCLYVHFDTSACFVAVGMWGPPNPELNRIRGLIDAQPDRWRRIVGAPGFMDAFEREGDSLKRVPRGYDKDHPLGDDLKLKSHMAVHRFDRTVATSPEFPDVVEEKLHVAVPYARFICEAIGQSF